MSQENVEIVRRSAELWNDEDWRRFGEVFDHPIAQTGPDRVVAC
jgi:hypothetical protein